MDRNPPERQPAEPAEPAGQPVASRHSEADDQQHPERRPPAGSHASHHHAAGQRTDRPAAGDREEARRLEFGGVNWGAAFFGWLVAIAIAVLATGIVGAIAAGVGASLSVTQDDAERSAGAIGLGTAIALLLVLMLGYYAGGYVAGRMSRYDGGRQGAAVWLIGLLATAIAAGIGVIFGDQYDALQRVDLAQLPIPTDDATVGGLVTLGAVLVGTLLTALGGGKVGHRYHTKFDQFQP